MVSRFEVLAIAAVLGGMAPPVQAATPGVASKFSELSAADVARLDRQRGVVATLLKRRYGVPSLAKTKADVPSLQRLLDDHAFAVTQTYELQCLGVAFGDILVSELGLRWVIVTDDYGRDPTLRFGETTIQINALTMISKRIERGEAVDLAVLLAKTREALTNARAELQRPRH
ncbi:MAG TPA: DUF3806 domain-containing protein [Polyangia bacterium]|nr:DUF3806 domain-containing protein [Polyangia bacterium]